MTEEDREARPDGPAPEKDPVGRLLDLMRTLRSGQGCPWDREQTLATLKPFLIEEAYETLEAIDSGDRQALCEELGDVLLQVVFQSQLCAEEGSFDFRDVAQGLGDKLIRRHPHVFGGAPAADSAEVLRRWKEIKRCEKKREAPASLLDGLPRPAPALCQAEEVQAKAARVGFDWTEAGQVMAKVEEELREVREALETGRKQQAAEELGDLLFAAVNLCRFLGEDAEERLRQATQKFVRRFRDMERDLAGREGGLGACSPEELDQAWNRAKTGPR